MKFPSFLSQSGKIGFPAPSFGCNIEPYKTSFTNAREKLKSMGHEGVPGPNAYLGEGIGISNTPEKCGTELTQMYLSEQTEALISCGGGELMCEILDYVDFNAIRAAKPKWYMGYSDNTNMTFLLNTLCDTASIYGPCAPAFGMEPWHPAIEDAYRLLRGEKLTQTGYALYETESLKDETNPLAPYNPTQERQIRLWQPDKADQKEEVRFAGRLTGGCLDILVNLAGTCYDRVGEFAERYQDEGVIWFLEACDLTVFSIRRALWELDHAGWFEHVQGFLIGRPLCMGQEMMGLDQYHAVTDILGKYNVPILMDLDIGHMPPMMPLICGSMAEVHLKGQAFTLRMECR